MTPVLVVCEFHLLPLRGGGALRAFHLLRQLARFHEVHAVVFQPEAELRRETEGYKVPDNVRLYSVCDEPPPRSVFDLLPRIGPGLKYRWLRRSWQGPADAVFLRAHHLVERVARSVPLAAAVFYELSAMKLAPVLRRARPSALRLVDLYNVNHDLVAQELRRRGCLPENNPDWQVIHWMEHHLQQFVHSFFACSDADRAVFERNCGLRGFTVGNGVDAAFYTPTASARNGGPESLVFTGWMGTEANKDALVWFRDELWPALRQARPALELKLVGGGMPADLAAGLAALPGVTVAGEVSDVRPHVRQARVAVVPLRIGSGTRLKILEAMAQGVPVVSTHKGAEGLGAADSEHLLYADDVASFVHAVLSLLEDASLHARLRSQARAFVEQTYDWNVIGDVAHRAMQSLLQRPH